MMSQWDSVRVNSMIGNCEICVQEMCQVTIEVEYVPLCKTSPAIVIRELLANGFCHISKYSTNKEYFDVRHKINK